MPKSPLQEWLTGVRFKGTQRTIDNQLTDVQLYNIANIADLEVSAYKIRLVSGSIVLGEFKLVDITAPKSH